MPGERDSVSAARSFSGGRWGAARGRGNGLSNEWDHHVSATYDVNKQMQVFGRIDNLFNQQYEEILFFGTPIRSVYGGVKLTF